MKKIFALCSILGTLPIMADVVKSTVHSVEKVDSNYLIKFENGRVGHISSFDKNVGTYKFLDLEGESVEAKLDGNYNLVSIKKLKASVGGKKTFEFEDSMEPPAYGPTIISDMAEATKIFKRLNPNYKRSSECSNRAHVWASEEFKNNNIKSMKIFVFFTASYINRVRLKWWFHVAPMLAVQIGEKVEGRVMDFMFNHSPVSVKEWTDQFVFSKRPCRPTTKFSEYDVNPQTEDCYQMEGPMYNWTPRDFHNQETQNRFKSDFSQGEIRAAYKEAF